MPSEHDHKVNTVDDVLRAGTGYVLKNGYITDVCVASYVEDAHPRRPRIGGPTT
jgi:hypothetical protein